MPIAYWAGVAAGAVLFRSWRSDPDEAGPNPPLEVNDDHYAYVRIDGK